MAAAEAEAAAWACMQLNMERRQRFTRSATLNFTTATRRRSSLCFTLVRDVKL